MKTHPAIFEQSLHTLKGMPTLFVVCHVSTPYSCGQHVNHDDFTVLSAAILLGRTNWKFRGKVIESTIGLIPGGGVENKLKIELTYHEAIDTGAYKAKTVAKSGNAATTTAGATHTAPPKTIASISPPRTKRKFYFNEE